MKRILFISLCLICVMAGKAQDNIDLSGLWDFCIGDSAKYDDEIVLPGSMLTNDKGYKVSTSTRWTATLYDSSFYFNPYMAKYRTAENLKFPFFLTPARHYVGKAWYRRMIYVPQSWADKRITLFLERPHIETTVLVNGKEVGHQNSLSTPHQYDITSCLSPGQRNKIEICVYNGIKNVGVGIDSHSVSDQTQGNWNGIIGQIELRASAAKPYIKKVKIVPYVGFGIVNLEIEIGAFPRAVFYQLPDICVGIERADKKSDTFMHYFEVIDKKVSLNVPLGKEAALWDEFHPQYYRMGITFGDDYYETTFGMCEIGVKDRSIFINGHPIMLRGTVENCCFPETGYPPMDEEEWTRIIQKCKQYGLNHMRFHSWCPPEAAFVAADKLGFYLMPEAPSWSNHGVKLRSGQIVDDYLIEESKRIVDTYGHHPSFVMMSAGNEPAGRWVEYCNDWVKEMKKYDASKIYCGAAVGGGWEWDNGSEFHVKGGARGLDWNNHAPHSDDDHNAEMDFPRNYKDEKPNNSPIIAHEQGQWCAFPDFKEISQYHGVNKPGNFEIFRDLLRDNGMASQAEKFLMASGKLQTLCYKYDIERNLRTKDYSGFQLLGLNDYSGQGTALVGPLNVHWNEKGYTDATEWIEFCSPVVALARFPKFVYSNRDTLNVPVELYNAMYADVLSVRNNYYITDDTQKVYFGGLLSVGNLPVGKNINIGKISLPLDTFVKPTKLTLSVLVAGKLRNHWDFWVYPEVKDTLSYDDIYQTDTLDAKALEVLGKGGKVLITAAGKVRLGKDVVQYYLPVFWNTSWFQMRPPHTTGAYIDKRHPLFKYDFPTDEWSNLNWWELLNRAQVMNLMELPLDYQPPIQPIDTWHISRKLGMLIEANVLKGRLLMTTMDITSNLEHRLVARQMRQAIIRYMESDDFKPTITLAPQTITDFFTKDGPKVDMYTKASPADLKPQIGGNVSKK